MSLKQKTVPETLPQPPSVGEETSLPAASSGKRGPRWAGLVFVALGTLAMALAAGDALAGARSGGEDDTLRGSGSGESLSGLAGDDSLFGGGGDDELYGGPGRDLLLGGGGDDFVEAKDGGRDYVDCGLGQDVASADGGEAGGEKSSEVADRVAPSCETVYPG